MPRYRYKAATSAGDLLEGEIESSSAEAVLERLHAEGHIPIRADEISEAAPARSTYRRRLRSGRVSQRDVEHVTQDLAALLESGFAMDKALKIQMEATESEPVRCLLLRVHGAVRAGLSLSAAMEAEGRTFTPLYLNMVRAGEAAGTLEQALHRLGEFMERSRELRESVTTALIYPLILSAAALVSLVLVLVVVVPRFSEMFEEAGEMLPWPTQIVVSAGAFLQHYWWLIALGAAGAAWEIRRQLGDSERRIRWDAQLLRLPVAGNLVAGVETARFCRTLGTLLHNGVSLLKAVSLAKEITGNLVMAQSIGRVADRVRQGHGLSQSLLEERAIPTRAGYMLRVGEEGGRLAEMLLRIAELYEREVQRSLRRLVTLIEPALILTMGLVIGGIVMSIVVAILAVNRLGAM